MYFLTVYFWISIFFYIQKNSSCIPIFWKLNWSRLHWTRHKPIFICPSHKNPWFISLLNSLLIHIQKCNRPWHGMHPYLSTSPTRVPFTLSPAYLLSLLPRLWIKGLSVPRFSSTLPMLIYDSRTYLFIIDPFELKLVLYEWGDIKVLRRLRCVLSWIMN